MTFLEAAIEILRHAREPLHFAEITKRAVDRKLLSHVGRDPETAMQTCLNSAVRNNTYEGLLLRDKPGHFQLRAGAALPELPLPPGARTQALSPRPGRAESDNGSNGLREASSKSPKPSAPAPASPEPSRSKKPSRRGGKKSGARRSEAELETEPLEDDELEGGAVEVTPVEVKPVVVEPVEVKPVEVTPAIEIDIDEIEPVEGDEAEDEPESDESEPDAERGFAAVSKQIPNLPIPALDPSKIRFRGPEGSGLEGDTDIALVMANAVSRLVEERPELREELEAMQQRPPAPEVVEVVRKRKEERRDERGRDERKDSQAALDDDRGGRRRRRRRRRSRRVEWSEGGPVRAAGAGSEELLDKVATMLAEAGTRSLHVRQIAEQLANQNVLGGEISEIERAVTAALLLDVHRRGDGSRFAVRGDARYQLRGSRLPEKVAAAEYAARRALLLLEQESEKQLLLWLQALGARSLEAIARIWLDAEDHTVLATLAPARGLGKLIVEEPESLAREREPRGDRGDQNEAEDDEGRVLVLLVPRKTAIEPKLWEGEAERNGCAGLLVFAMGDVGADLASPDTRVIGASELARWMIRQRIGVRTARFEVPVLDADLIESIGGLDT
jgi:hypothetical protein